MPRLSWLCLLLWAGCATFDPKHPLVGKPSIAEKQLGYWIWVDGGGWHLRMTSGKRPRRFQGSLTAVSGRIKDLQLTRPDLKDRIARVGNAVVFDVESRAADGAVGFDAQLSGSCARFDLLIGGQYRAEYVRLGPRLMATKRIPFEKCQ